MLQTVRDLHDHGIILCDLTDGNVVWDLAPLDHYTPEQRYQLMGRPRKSPLNHPNWKFGELVEPMTIPLDLVRTDRVFICDFGLSIRQGQKVTFNAAGAASACAPERFHGYPPSPASDMWSFGCLLYHLHSGRLLSPFGHGGRRSTLDAMVRTIQRAMPPEWKARFEVGEYKDKWYDQKQVIIDDRWTLGGTLQAGGVDVGPRELGLLVDVLSKLFCYIPKDRITAAQLLEDPSFKAMKEAAALKDRRTSK